MSKHAAIVLLTGATKLLTEALRIIEDKQQADIVLQAHTAISNVRAQIEREDIRKAG